MNDLRKKRLLLLASTPNGWHKRFYSQYCELMYQDPPLTGWVLGTAYLTEEGSKELERLKNE